MNCRSLALVLVLVAGCTANLGCTPDRSSYYGDFRPNQAYRVKQEMLLLDSGAMTRDPDVGVAAVLYILTPSQGIAPADRARAIDTIPAGIEILCIGAFKNLNSQSKTYEWVDIRARILDGSSRDRIASIHDIAGPDPKHRTPDPRYLEPLH